MKKLLFTVLSLSLGLTNAQNPEKNLSGDIPTDYIRPGLLILHNKQGGQFDFNNFKFPAQFDEIKIENQEFSYSFEFQGMTSADVLNKTLSGEKVSKEERQKAKENDSLYGVMLSKEYSQIISKFTGQLMSSVMEIENGQPNWEKLFERSRNSLTESQRNQLKNLSGGSLGENAQNLLLDPILERNYIMVISPYGRTETEDGLTSGVTVAVFKVDLAEGTDIQAKKNVFFSKFGKNYGQVKDSEFPVTFLGLGVGTAQSFDKKSLLSMVGLGNNKKNSRTPEEKEYDLNNAIIDQGIQIGMKFSDDWKPRAIVQDRMKVALGEKEGLRIDDLYISYERVKNEDGEVELVKKGYDRVKKVGKNNIDLTETETVGEPSKLYGDSGKRTKTGYVSMRQPELGLGISAFYRNSAGARVDYRTKVIPNTMVYLEGEFMGQNELLGGSDILVSLGVQKYLNLGRKIALIPFAQYGTILNSGELDEDTSSTDEANVAGFVGSRLSIKFGTKIQLIPEVSILVGELDTSEVGYGIKLKESYSDKFGDGAYLGFTLRYNL
jgi:hypothetical protein